MFSTVWLTLTLSPPSTAVVPYANNLNLDETPSNKLFDTQTTISPTSDDIKHLETISWSWFCACLMWFNMFHLHMLFHWLGLMLVFCNLMCFIYINIISLYWFCACLICFYMFRLHKYYFIVMLLCLSSMIVYVPFT